MLFTQCDQISCKEFNRNVQSDKNLLPLGDQEKAFGFAGGAPRDSLYCHAGIRGPLRFLMLPSLSIL